MSEETSHYFNTISINNATYESVDLNEADTIKFESSDENEDRESMEIYLCLLVKKNKIGGAFYEVNTGILSLIPNYEDTNDYFYIKQSILQWNPTIILLSSNCEQSIVNNFRKCDPPPSSDYQDSEEGTNNNSSGVELIHPKGFSLDLGHRMLLECNLPYIPKSYSTEERHVFMKSLIPFDNDLMVRSASALINYLQSKRVGIELEPIIFDIPVVDIRIHVPNRIMRLGSSVLRSLQIFNKVSHPSAFKKGKVASLKEGLSLYNFLDTCRSKLGSVMMRSWLLRPLCNLEEIRIRLNIVSMLTAPLSQQTVKELENAVKLLGNIRKLILRMKQSTVTSGMWCSFCKTLNCFMMLANALQPFRHTELHIADRFQQLFTIDVVNKIRYVLDVVDMEATIREKEFTVNSGVFSELDHLRESYLLLPGLLSELAKEEMKKLNEIIEECAIIYTPQVGYLVSVPSTYECPQDLDEHGLYYMYTSENSCFYRNQTTNELNKNIGDIYMQIKDFQTDVMHNVQETILEISDQLLKAADLAAEIDCFLAFTTAAKAMNAVPPQFIQDNKIIVKKGRHPLMEICKSEFVPNATLSGEDEPRITVITGPNSCGKSVYLKQIGILVYLAHIGSFVPAESMQLGVINSIHTRIKSIESNSSNHSSFLTDCNEVGMAIRDHENFSAARQIVLLDEFGSGATQSDGLSILAATLNYYINQKENCPHVFVSTHYRYSSMKPVLKDSPILSYKTLKTMEDSEGNVIYLYELTDGYCKKSHASFVAKMVGLPLAIIERGDYVTSMLSNLENLSPIEMLEGRNENNVEEVCRSFLNFDFDNSTLEEFSDVVSSNSFRI